MAVCTELPRLGTCLNICNFYGTNIPSIVSHTGSLPMPSYTSDLPWGWLSASVDSHLSADPVKTAPASMSMLVNIGTEVFLLSCGLLLPRILSLAFNLRYQSMSPQCWADESHTDVDSNEMAYTVHGLLDDLVSGNVEEHVRLHAVK
jgi:hypothetical protein